jgi:hypothetical protein
MAFPAVSGFSSSPILATFAAMKFTVFIIFFCFLLCRAFAAGDWPVNLTFENKTQLDWLKPGSHNLNSVKYDVLVSPECGLTPPINCKKNQQQPIASIPVSLIGRNINPLSPNFRLLFSELFDNTSLSQLYPHHNFW